MRVEDIRGIDKLGFDTIAVYTQKRVYVLTYAFTVDAGDDITMWETARTHVKESDSYNDSSNLIDIALSVSAFLTVVALATAI